MVSLPADVLASVDILAIIEKDTRLKYVSHTSGGEWAGPCPFCRDAGIDRFRVWPKHNSGRGRWWCRRCERGGDAIDYLEARDGLSFREALQVLGVDADQVTSATGKSDHRQARPMAPSVEPPCQEWQERARAMVQWAQEQLWSDGGQGALVYLHEVRGLSNETIRRFGLGYNPGELYDRPVSKWGLDTGRAVYISLGIVIPCQVDNAMWYVQIRRPHDPGDGKSDALLAYLDIDLPGWKPEAKYVAIRGGINRALFGADLLQGKPDLALCEGEFDAMLLWQEAHDHVDVAAFGGAAKINQGIPGRWRLRIAHYARILVAFDADEAGQAGAEALLSQSRRAVRIGVPYGGDIGGFRQAGGNVRGWLEAWLDKFSKEAEEHE